MENLEPIILYKLPGCPYCTKVSNALTEHDLRYESKKVPMQNSKRTELQELTGGPTGVPVIQDPNTDEFTWLNESDDIIEYLNQTYGK